jgi:hypothetical protein
MSTDAKSHALYQNLDTSFVNLWALLRYLSQRGFVGRVHVELKDYTADVFVDGSSTPLVHEVDHATGADVLEEAALHRLVLRARESDGSITVFEGANEAIPPRVSAPSAAVLSGETSDREPEIELFELVSEESEEERPHESSPVEPASESSLSEAASGEIQPIAVEEKDAADSGQAKTDTFAPVDSAELVKVSGALIGGVERALNALGANFDALFIDARLSLADDYDFLDPTSANFQYAAGAVTLSQEPPADAYVAGLSEALRRVVEQAANGARGGRLRERVGLELALAARKNPALARSGFGAQLDRIAGTRVL